MIDHETQGAVVLVAQDPCWVCGTPWSVDVHELLATIDAQTKEIERLREALETTQKIARFWRLSTRSAIGPRNSHAIPVEFDTVDAEFQRVLAATSDAGEEQGIE